MRDYHRSDDYWSVNNPGYHDHRSDDNSGHHDYRGDHDNHRKRDHDDGAGDDTRLMRALWRTIWNHSRSNDYCGGHNCSTYYCGSYYCSYDCSGGNSSYCR
jgi:hypothetical protein